MELPEIKDPKQMKCNICGKFGAWIMLYTDFVCSPCMEEFNRRRQQKNVLVMEEIINEMKGLKEEKK